MANIIGIVGASGTGKSTALRTLDPKTTFIVNVQGKPLPFKDSSQLYSTEKKNIATLDK